MTPHVISPPADIGLDFQDKEIFLCLEKMKSGCTPPGNVITYVNPYSFAPYNLPDGIWYLIQSRENDATKFGAWKVKGEGAWKVKGEASKLFSNPLITGWRTTIQFFVGEVPHEHKTDWIMQQYWITRKELGEDSKAKEGSSLCRVFLGGCKDPDCERKQEEASPIIASETHIYSTQSISPVANSDSSYGCSKSKPEDENADETGNFAAERSLNHLVENIVRSDSFSSGGFIELQDLEDPLSPSSIPVSPSSSSNNSSCFTMSSDEFDPQALLQEIESDSKQELEQKNGNCKFSVSALLQPNEVVVVRPAPSASLVSIGGTELAAREILKPDSPTLPLTDSHKEVGNEVLRNPVSDRTRYDRDEGPSSKFYDPGETSSSSSSLEGDKKAAKHRKKKANNKYLCFMPFF